MPKVSHDVLQRVRAAFERYQAEVDAAPLAPYTKHTYLLHAEHFVRWLDDDFEPGIRKRGGA